ncbi:MAG: M13 family metallopeptidase [Fluviicola sp.]|nr:M13 family metallopeptidase [Fluviicola sp.]
MKKIILPIALIFAVTSCDTAKNVTEEIAETNAEVIEGSNYRNQTIDIDFMNDSVRPQHDFFEFANGTWLQNNPVPPSESRWGSFNELDVANKKKLTILLEEASKLSTGKGSTNQILGDYYQSFLNMELRNKYGTFEIEDELLRIDNMISKSDLASTIAEQHLLGIGSLFSFGVGQNLKDVDNHIAYFGQGGIGLPNKDYYSSDDKEEIKAKYLLHIIAIFKLAGNSSEVAEKMAKAALHFEEELASVMMTPSELRIPENTYNKFSSKQFFKGAGLFNMEHYLSHLEIETFDSLVVSQPKFLVKIAKMVRGTDLDDWKSYLKWSVLNRYAGHLDEKFVKQNFEFYGKVLKGKSEMKPINARAIDEITHQEFGELLGKAFVGRHYSDVAAQKVNTMVDNLLYVFKERINKLGWMSGDTKKQALIKLGAIGRKLGYPDVWEDFSGLNFVADNYLRNINEAALYASKKNLAKLYKPVNKDEWGMPAHMINAYYHPLLNEIAFPAGIMQAPFFSENFEDAVNYGRIGMVIGHEFTHGFDDMGSKFAADGSFTNWWSTDDRTAFEERTGKLGATFEGFCPVEGHCVNSSLTMGENIADLGGLTMAYYAYTRTDEFKAGISRKGYTPAQRFFLAYAQLWKINYTEEELKNRIANDPHSPGMYRVNGPLMNCPEFFKAFDVKEGDAMRNESSKVAKIW